MNDRRQNKHGIAATELAICLPLLCTLSFFCIHLAQGYHIRAVADQAAWRAIRYASTTRFRDDEVEQWKSEVTAQAVEHLSQLTRFEPEKLSVQVDVTKDNERVDIKLKLDLVIEAPLKLIPGDLEVHRNLQIRQYR